MKIYDISQEVLSCEVYPGDPTPTKETLISMSDGNLYNLSAFRMCAHNGTHVDAPFHFIDSGKTVDQISIDHFIGFAYVTEHQGYVKAKDAQSMLKKASLEGRNCDKRILIKGKVEVTLEAAEVFAAANILLLGNESQCVGPKDAPLKVHKILLSVGVVLLEGIRLRDVPEGVYLLNAAPLNLAGFDGAPCRAVLLKL